MQIYSPKILPVYKNVNYQVCARFACSNFLFSQIFCEYLKDNRENHTKGNTDVSRLFLLQLMETQIGFKLVGLRNNSKHFHVKIFLFPQGDTFMRSLVIGQAGFSIQTHPPCTDLQLHKINFRIENFFHWSSIAEDLSSASRPCGALSERGQQVRASGGRWTRPRRWGARQALEQVS